MIPASCKRLAEVDFPIAEVSRHAAREKSIRHGHPSTLHLWWARRPLASSRAMLMALLLPDPCDPDCPKSFKTGARDALLAMHSRASGWDAEVATDEGLRRTLLRFIADFSNWDNAAKPEYLETGRALVRAAHPDETPLVVDPFAGGGSIPLEALRLGCDAFASDLNPVACLILKVMLEDIPRHGPGLADELRSVGAEIRAKAEAELAELYPKDPDGATPTAYLWARTVRCESPGCGAEIPLMRSMWLSKKAKRKRALQPTITRTPGSIPHAELSIFEPKADGDVASGTVSRAKAKCLCCGTVLPPERVHAQLSFQRGGADTIFNKTGQRTGGARMTAVVTTHPGESGRQYRPPTDADYAAVGLAQERIATLLAEWENKDPQALCPVPDEPTPTKASHRAVGSQLPVYGISRFGDLFTSRQKTALVTLCRLARANCVNGPETLERLLALAVSKQTERLSSTVSWILATEAPRGTFARQAFPMVWDYLELVPFGEQGEFVGLLDAMAKVIESYHDSTYSLGQIAAADAARHPLPDHSTGLWFTDPPYYDAIPYADLSDFFLVWIKRVLVRDPMPTDPYDRANSLSPKGPEAIQCEKVKDLHGRPKDKSFYEETMAQAFAEGRRLIQDAGIGSIVFAHKSTEGWEALLSGIIRGEWTVTGSWPLATERHARPNAQENASLAGSVHLVCRPRPKDAPIGDWGEVLRELPSRVGEWMYRLQKEGVRGADLVFACVGPALEVYSRYRSVETPDGREVGLPEYLEKVWEVVGREALQQVLGTAEASARNGTAGALEEDSRLTALFLWTIQSTADSVSASIPLDEELGDADDANDRDDEDDDAPNQRRASGYSLPFDVTRRFAQPLGIHLEDWETRIIRTEKGVVRLLPVRERAKQLFGEAGAAGVAEELETTSSPQLRLFPDDAPTVRGTSRRRGRTAGAGGAPTARAATTLDRVHAAMLLQASGRTQGLRTLLREEQERGPDFLRLANALSALYPRSSEEKRLLDGMLLAVGR